MDEEVGRSDVELVEGAIDGEAVEEMISEELQPVKILDCMDQLDGPVEVRMLICLSLT